jgi:hypothetical protein
MRNWKNVPAYSLKTVSKSHTYDFGVGDRSNGYGYEVSNGRVIEKYQRRNIFYKQHNIVKV